MFHAAASQILALQVMGALGSLQEAVGTSRTLLPLVRLQLQGS